MLALLFSFLGARQSGAVHGVVPQRQLDGDGRPCGLRQVLAVQYEQCEDVPGTQRGATRHKVSTTSLRPIYICIYSGNLRNKCRRHLPSPLICNAYKFFEIAVYEMK